MRLQFICVGAQKCGTTTLKAYLHQHPDLHLPRRQELHFFDDESQPWPTPDLDAYHRHFRIPRPFMAASSQGGGPTEVAGTCAAPPRKCGEVTPIYIYWNPSIARIKQYNPAIRLIILLRNPMARAYSHWAMASAGKAEHLSFSEAIRNERTRCEQAAPRQPRHHAYVDRGKYYHQVKRVFEYFPRKQVLILRSEQFFSDPLFWLSRIHEFLGVTPMEPHSLQHRRKGSYPTPMNLEDWHYIYGQLSSDIDRLENLLGWDCSDWRLPWF